MLDPMQATNAREPVTLAGSDYPVRQLSVGEWAELQGWLRKATPNPVRVAAEAVQEAARAGNPLGDQVVRGLYAAAQAEARAWPPAIGGKAWLAALDSVPEGAARFVRAALAGGGTDLPLAECERLVEAAAGGELGELLRVAYWGGPATAPKPAAPNPTTTTTGAARATTGAPSSTG